MNSLTPERLSELADLALQMTLNYVPRVLLAGVVLLFGLWLIRRVVRWLDRTLTKDADPTLSSFLVSLLSIGLKLLLFVSVASMVGVATTSFVALLGAAGLAIGLALQGSLANFAGGVLILLFRPFKVGDFIEGQGVTGSVRQIQIFHTVLHTPDNKVVIVPNGALSNGVITNFSSEPLRRCDIVFGVGYDDDLQQAKSIIADLLRADKRVLDTPATQILVTELADSAVNITVRAWVNADDLWDVRFDTLEAVKQAFDAAGIQFPYPQRQVHMRQLQQPV